MCIRIIEIVSLFVLQYILRPNKFDKSFAEYTTRLQNASKCI